jgi:hypothetical protein
MLQLLISVSGWAGTFLILAAFFMSVSGRMKGSSIYYLLMNLFGSLGVLANVLYYMAIPAAFLEIVWAAVSLYGIYSYASALRHRESTNMGAHKGRK